MEYRMGEALRRVNHLAAEIDAAYHEAAWKLGLSDSAMQILYTICNYGTACPLNEIIHLSGIRKQTVNSALRKLEAEGVLYLETYQGRRKMVYLTDRGTALARDTVLRIIEIENKIFDSWAPEQRALYVELMEKYRSSFQEEIQKL